MKHKKEILNIKLSRELDRRVKYTEEDKNHVKKLHSDGHSQRAIARQTGISRRYISFILYPERLVKVKEQYKQRRLDGRYYIKEKHREAISNLRKYKRQLLKDGIINY